MADLAASPADPSAVPRRHASAWAPAAGLSLVVVLTALDALWGEQRVISATVVLGAFVAASSGTVRQTALVAITAVVACTFSAVWNANFGDVDYVVREVVVVAGAVLAVAASAARVRLALDRARFRALAAAADLGDTPGSVEATTDRVRGLIVPQFADTCAIDVDAPPAAATGTLTADGLAITVALRARGAAFGALHLALDPGRRRRYGDDDLQFAQLLAGRVALALDNAGLFSEVETLAAQQTAALGSLDEAVTIQTADGRLIYANDAAARAFGFATPQELVDTAPQDLVDAFEVTDEDGSPIRSGDLPGRRVLAGDTPGPLLVRAVDRRTREERWRLIRATAVRGAAGDVAMAVNVVEDVTDVKRAERAQRFLAEVSMTLSSSLDHEETLARVARLAVPQLADWCAVSLPDEHGYLRSVAIAHRDEAQIELAREYDRRFAARVGDEGGAAQVMRDGASQLVNEIPDELLEQAVDDPDQLGLLRGLRLRAVMLVPMVCARGVIGVMSFVSAESGRRFSAADLRLAEELGRRAGTAVDNARLYTERSRIARTLQAGLLPDALPDISGFAVASLYRPAGEENFVGGDFYDAFPTPAGWMVFVGDVTGRGTEAAALTAQARHTLRTAGTLLGDPVAAVDELNRALSAGRDLPICTVAVVLLVEDETEGTLADVVCAGHPQPLLVRAGRAAPVGASGPMVGAWLDSAWTAQTVRLEPDDVLVLFTDGVTDACGRSDRFGEERLAATLAPATSAPDAVDRVRDALVAFERGAQADDTAVVAVQRLPVGVPAAS